MSVVAIEGHRFAAGLFWLRTAEGRDIHRLAAASGREYRVQYADQTGLADNEGDPQEISPLAAAVAVAVGAGEATWTAAVRTDDGLICVVRCDDGEFPRDGDRIFDDEQSAFAAFQAHRDEGGGAFATPGTFSDAPPETLAVEDIVTAAGRVLPLRRQKVRSPLRTAVVAGLLAIGLPAGGYLGWEVFIKEPPPPPKVPIPMVDTATDRLAFIEGCERARRRVLLDIAGWDLQRVSCTVFFGQGEDDLANLQKAVLSVDPDFAEGPVLLAEWSIRDGLEAAVWRRVAEDRLSEAGSWKSFQMAGRQLWAGFRLPPVVREAEAPQSYLEYRGSLERAFALHGADMVHGEQPITPDGPASAVLDVPYDLARIYRMLGPVTGLEVLRVRNRHPTGWIIDVRKQEVSSIPEETFREILAAN